MGKESDKMKNLQFILSLKIIFLFTFFFFFTQPTSAQTKLTTCSDLINGSWTYNLTQHVAASIGSCINIMNNNIILDCQSYNVNYSNSFTGPYYGINNSGGYANVTIKNCFVHDIIANFTGNHAIYISDASNGSILNNTIFIEGPSSSGIMVSAAKNFTVADNNITGRNSTTGAFGLLHLNSTNNTLVERNSLNSTGANFAGILLFSSSNNTIKLNKVVVVNNGNPFNVQQLQARTNMIDSNTFMSVGFGGIIRLQTSPNETFMLNNNLSSTQDIADEVLDSTSGLVLNYLIYNNTFGDIRWTNKSFNRATSVRASGLGFGLGVNLWISNNTFTFNATSIISSQVHNQTTANITLFGLNFSNVTNILRVDYLDRDYGNITQSSLAYDCTKTGLGCQILEYNSTTGKLVFNADNVSASFTANGTYATSGDASPLYVANTEANGTAKNQSFVLMNITVVNSTTLVGYNFTIANSSTVNRTDFITHNTTFTFNFSIPGLGNDTYLYNVTVHFSGGSNTTENRVLFLDSRLPVINFILNTEASSAQLNQQFVLMNVSVTNEQNIANITFTVSNSTTVNTTTYSTLNTTFIYNFSVLGLGNDTYRYNVSVRDLANNFNISENRVLTIDNKLPALTFLTNTEANGTNKSQNYILINGSITNEPNIANITFTIANRTTVNSTTYSITNTTITFNFSMAGLGNDTYSYNFSVRDLANNLNTSETRVIFLDQRLPVIHFIPTTEPNATAKNQGFVLFNTSIQNERSYANITFSISNSTTVNTTTFTTSNITLTFNFSILGLGNDTYLYNITVTDYANNQNTSETRVIFLDQITPVPVFLTPTEPNGTVKNQRFILTNTLANDANPANYTFVFANSTTVNTTTLVSTNNTVIFNFSALGLGNGSYTYNVTVRDRANNVNLSENRILILDHQTTTIDLVANTSASGNALNDSHILVNVTLGYEANPANLTFTFRNSSGMNQTTYTTSNTTFTFNFTIAGIGLDRFFYNTTIRDLANNENTTETRNITIGTVFAQPPAPPAAPPPAPPSGGGSGGGGGTSAQAETRTYDIAEQTGEIIEEGVTQFDKSLGQNEKVRFRIKQQPHTLTLLEIREKAVHIRIESTPQEAIILQGETKNFDLDEDGKQDLAITVEAIFLSSAKIIFTVLTENTHLGEEQLPSTDEPSPYIGTPLEVIKQKSHITPFILTAIGILILGMSSYLIFKHQKKAPKKRNKTIETIKNKKNAIKPAKKYSSKKFSKKRL